jgi:hypothetical protein
VALGRPYQPCMANYDIYVHIQICNSCWCQTPFSGFAPTSTECQVRAEPCQSVYCSQINQESSNKVNSVHCGQRMAHWALGVLGHGSYVGHTKPSSQEKHSPKNLGVGWSGWMQSDPPPSSHSSQLPNFLGCVFHG